jgi:hypothetical protein
MSKYGVGVGDEFPVDDGNANAAGGNQAPRDDRADYEEWKRRREAHRAQREQWRAQREEWRDRKRAFKEKIRAAARESFGDDYGDRRGYGRGDFSRFGHGRRGFRFGRGLFVLVPILAIVLFVALIAAIIKSPFVFLALVLAGFFFFGHRFSYYGHRFAGHGWHSHDRYGRDYDFDLKPSSRGPEEKPANATIVTPPPAQTPPATS